MIIEIILGIAAVMSLVISWYLLVRNSVREAAEEAIVKAEDLQDIGEKKMELAIQLVYNMIPAAVKPFVTKTMVRLVIQTVFDQMEEYAKKQVK